MLLHQHFIPGLAIASYVVGDERSGEAAVIDPTREVEAYIRFARKHDLHIRHIIETHVHADFVSGARELKARLKDEPTIHCSAYGGKDWTQPYPDQHVKEGDTVEFGSVRLGFQHSPGHTPEHISVLLYDKSRSEETPWVMFSGDFLFVGDVGRPDLLGESARRQLAHELYQSVFERITSLPDFTEIFPAHGAGSLCGKAIGSRRSSTLGYERLYNGSLRKKPEEQWVRDLLEDMPLSPPYFKRMKKVNKEGPAIIGPELPGLKRWTASQLYERVCEQCLILDTRHKGAFAASHIADAINIPFGNNLPTWAGWVLPYDRPILLVTEHRSQVEEIVTHLLRVGFDDVQGSLEGGMDAWETAGLPLVTLSTLSVQDLKQRLDRKEKLTVLDVRTESEWNSGHIGGAIHIHGGKLEEHFGDVPRDRPVAVVCGSGYRASIAASFLQRNGYEDVSNVVGGMSAWNAAKLPTTQR
jgi:hydroxyacylglutathione hydrolase